MESGELPKEGQGGGVDSPSSFSDPLSPPMMLIGSVSPVDTILILFISICTALLSEALTYVLVYRTRHYKKLKAEVCCLFNVIFEGFEFTLNWRMSVNSMILLVNHISGNLKKTGDLEVSILSKSYLRKFAM